MSNVNTINANGEWYPIEDETARDKITSLENNVTDLTKEVTELNSALADKVEVQSGDINLSSGDLPASSYYETQVTFPKAFSSTPGISLTLGGGTSSNYGMVSLMSAYLSTTGFTLRVFNSSTSSSLQPVVRWAAIGIISS